MGINKEKVGNISLGLLIIVSFFLSYNLWTAGGNVNEIEENELQTADAKLSVVDHTMEDTFRPTKVALHGFTSPDEILLADTYPLKNFLSSKMETANLYQVEYSDTVSYEDYLDTLDTDAWIEFIYNEEQPIGLLSDKFAEMSKDISSSFFDRIIINTNNREDIYLYHTKAQSIYEISLIEGESIDIEPFLNLENLQYLSAEATILSNNIVYLPIESQKIPYKSYVIDKLPTSTYISDFFPDTSLVDVRSAETFTRYIDLSKEVTINDKNDTLVFYKQSYSTASMDPVERYEKSFEQIDRFENWADTFVVCEYDPESEVISFRREIEGIPVFSTSNHESVSEVSLTEDEVTHLKLPLRYTSTPISINESSKSIKSGKEILQEIESVTSTKDFEKVEDIRVGYTWEEDEEESEVAYFKPEWYILYDGNWMNFNTFLKSHEEAAYGF